MGRSVGRHCIVRSTWLARCGGSIAWAAAVDRVCTRALRAPHCDPCRRFPVPRAPMRRTLWFVSLVYALSYGCACAALAIAPLQSERHDLVMRCLLAATFSFLISGPALLVAARIVTRPLPVRLLRAVAGA